MLGHLLVLLVLNEKNMKGGNPYTPYKLPYLYLRGVGLGAGAAGSSAVSTGSMIYCSNSII
jgi:hypothetical protein